MNKDNRLFINSVIKSLDSMPGLPDNVRRVQLFAPPDEDGFIPAHAHRTKIEDMDEFVANANRQVRGENNDKRGIFIDYDHQSLFGDSTAAKGWCKDFILNNDNSLDVVIEFLPDCWEFLKNNTDSEGIVPYRHLSADFNGVDNAEFRMDDDGEYVIARGLRCISLTNDPNMIQYDKNKIVANSGVNKMDDNKEKKNEMTEEEKKEANSANEMTEEEKDKEESNAANDMHEEEKEKMNESDAFSTALLDMVRDTVNKVLNEVSEKKEEEYANKANFYQTFGRVASIVGEDNAEKLANATNKDETGVISMLLAEVDKSLGDNKLANARGGFTTPPTQSFKDEVIKKHNSKVNKEINGGNEVVKLSDKELDEVRREAFANSAGLNDNQKQELYIKLYNQKIANKK